MAISNQNRKGQHLHSKDDAMRANISGQKRTDLKKILKTKKPTEVKRDLMQEKLSENRADLEAGNFNMVPTAACLQKMSSEESVAERNHLDVFQDLRIERDKINEEYGDNTVFLLSETPFSFGWCSKQMAQHVFDMSRQQNKLFVHCDASGGMVQRPPWEKEKQVLNYVIAVKGKKTAPIPVTELVTNNHHAYNIAFWLAQFLERIEVECNTRVVPFNGIVIDMSWALTNAILQEFVGGISLINYLYSCIEAKTNGSVAFVMVAWCYAHFINAVKKKVCKWVPVKSHPYSPARKCAKFFFAELSRTTNVEDACYLLVNAKVVFCSVKFTKAVHEALLNLATRFGVTESHLTSLDDPDDGTVEDMNISFPKRDRACSALNSTYQDSPFYKIFSKKLDGVVLEEGDNNDKPNPFLIKPLFSYLLKYYLPYYPFWSRYLQSLLLPNVQNPLTNSTAELYFEIFH